MSDATFILKLKPEEVRAIYNALLKRPYEEVAETIQTFVTQVQTQEAALESKKKR